MSPSPIIVAVAVPLKLPRTFDYRLPPNCPAPPVGCRVKVRFANRPLIGWVVETKTDSDWPLDKLHPIEEVIDQIPLLSDELWQLLIWTHRYYHHPLGEVLATALPAPLRGGSQQQIVQPKLWRLTDAGRLIDPASLKRSPRQADVLAALTSGPKSPGALRDVGTNAVIKRLLAKGWVEQIIAKEVPAASMPSSAQAGPILSDHQRSAVDAISESLGDFGAHLLDGVTGSGKTEVYLHVIEKVLTNARQALVVVPEIALTPQLLERFRGRLGCEVEAMHSGQTDRERVQIWLKASAGQLPVIVGTRSAIFVPLRSPGLIVVDEEHDLSLKQQDGLRYSARDLAVQRARQNNIPIMLGSATPSLESLNNALNQRYQHLILPSRAGAASQPTVELIDLRTQATDEGIATGLRQRIVTHLKRGEQVILFLNRRGFAPVLMCDACGWYAECDRCDARMTWHRAASRLRCHHCDREQSVPRDCPNCRSTRLGPVGAGTERLDNALSKWFSDYPVQRLDRDTTRGKGQLESIRAQLKSGEPSVVIGTQMLAKGHDFPNVTLVGVVNIDQSLFSSDFRAAERAAQLLVQVSGRAGRAEKPGTVIVQTHHPDHPLFFELLASGYNSFAKNLLRERHAAGFPPYGYMALLRAEAHQKELVEKFLNNATHALRNVEINVFGPLPAPMERRAGRYRMQLLLLSAQRRKLQQTLQEWVPTLYSDKTGSRVRWSLDVDPQESF